jgi:hypothetical protein
MKVKDGIFSYLKKSGQQDIPPQASSPPLLSPVIRTSEGN